MQIKTDDIQLEREPLSDVYVKVKANPLIKPIAGGIFLEVRSGLVGPFRGENIVADLLLSITRLGGPNECKQSI
jgi:hypothetical protein